MYLHCFFPVQNSVLRRAPQVWENKWEISRRRAPPVLPPCLLLLFPSVILLNIWESTANRDHISVRPKKISLNSLPPQSRGDCHASGPISPKDTVEKKDLPVPVTCGNPELEPTLPVSWEAPCFWKAAGASRLWLLHSTSCPVVTDSWFATVGTGKDDQKASLYWRSNLSSFSLETKTCRKSLDWIWHIPNKTLSNKQKHL